MPENCHQFSLFVCNKVPTVAAIFQLPELFIVAETCGHTSKLNSVALVRERTIPTERPPPVGEVSANFLRVEGCHVVSATGPHGR